MANKVLFNCSILGPTVERVFSAKVLQSITVNQLKDVVKEKEKSRIGHINSDELDIFMLSKSLARDEILPTLGEIPAGGTPPGTELDPLNELLDYFPQAPVSGRLHLVLRAPGATISPSRSGGLGAPVKPSTVLGKRPRGFGNPLWLEELHSKIWNRGDLKSQLFRQVEVTGAHYAALQKHLNDQYPDRNWPDYEGSQRHVGGIKLDFLDSIISGKALFPPHPNNNENGVDDTDFDVESLFPSILRYLDFSALELQKQSARLPSPLYLRQEYDDISELIANDSNLVIVSGQPGTGKTAYLHLRMVQSMLDGRQFLYQDTNRIVYHVAGKGIESIDQWPLTERIMAFVDGDGGDYAPRDFLYDPFVQILVAASPLGANGKWIKQVPVAITRLAIKLWSPRELFLTGIFLYPRDISFELLKESTSYFGHNPRRCFHASTSESQLERHKSRVILRARDAALSTPMRLVYASQLGDPGPELSNTFFEIFPSNDSRYFEHCQFGAVSQWALDLLLMEYEKNQADAAASMYRALSYIPDAASLQGHIFERQVLNYLDDIKAPRDFTICGLTNYNQTTWTYSGPIRSFTFREQTTFRKELTKAVESGESLHLRPAARNFPTVDSILYNPNDSHGVFTCIQTTVSSEHPIAVSGLQHVQSWLMPKTALADLCPSETTPWRFIFVVPRDTAPDFKLQKLQGDTAMGVWAGKVQQHVLEFDVLSMYSGALKQCPTSVGPH